MPLTPLDFAFDLLDRAETLAAHAGNPVLAEAWSVEKDILRSSWVFVGASIDTYFHERVRRALTTRPMSSAAEKYAVQLGPVEDMIDRFLADRERSRPRVVLKNILHDALLKDTFQGSRNIERAFGLVGVSKPWKSIADTMNDTSDSVKGKLDRQYARRNRIAHQGDYSRQERPQYLWYDEIDRSDVDADLVWTRRFLEASDQV